MKGLVFLFAAIVLLGAFWRYGDGASKKMVVSILRGNIIVIALAILAVAIAVFFSINSTVRLV